jgi:hypothetical protein
MDKETDILIFHEGNIHHQNEIQQETPSLHLKFIDVKKDGFAFNVEREQVKIDSNTVGFGMGYRHMCSFWFVDFWKFVEEYDYILRIDEDCFIEFVPDKVFDALQTTPIITGRCEDDMEFVTKGLNQYTQDFMIDRGYSKQDPKHPGGPYTNLIGFHSIFCFGFPPIARSHTRYVKRLSVTATPLNTI